jgi:hypothetical protein
MILIKSGLRSRRMTMLVSRRSATVPDRSASSGAASPFFSAFSFYVIMVRIGIGVSNPRRGCSPSGCQSPAVTRAKDAVASSG